MWFAKGTTELEERLAQECVSKPTCRQREHWSSNSAAYKTTAARLRPSKCWCTLSVDSLVAALLVKLQYCIMMLIIEKSLLLGWFNQQMQLIQ